MKKPTHESTVDAHNFSKVYSRLRMIANGGNAVNKVRSQFNPTVTFQTEDETLEDVVVDIISAAFGNQQPIEYAIGDVIQQVLPQKSKTVSPKETQVALKKGKLDKDPPSSSFVHVFIDLRADITWSTVLKDLTKKHPTIKSKISDVRIEKSLVQAKISLDVLGWLAASPYIHRIESSQSLRVPPPVRYHHALHSAPASRNPVTATSIDGKNVIIGIIDVGGYDFAHQDFLTADGKTRFLTIWDQGGTQRDNPSKTFKNETGASDFKGLNYGAVIQRSHMNLAIVDAPDIGVPIHKLEPQSQQYPSSHATHVASIAAGNTGVCSGADIAAVLVELPQDDLHRTKTFTDSTRITDAVDFLLAVAKNEGRPISINISLGTNGHAHDGSSAVNRWIDAKLSTEGRCLCVATGNAGQEKGVSDDDFGYIMGRIHTSGQIVSKGLMTDLEWHVIGDGNVDISENELELWYKPQDRFSVMIKPPGGAWIGPVPPQKIVENLQLPDKSFISVYNTLYHRANGDNHIAIYLSPNLNETKIVGVRSGLWKVRLIGDEIRDGRYDAWIERDDPVRRSQTFWNLPSFFSENTNVDKKSINSLACGQNVIAVGNFDTDHDKVNISSSQGPTRDDREKPEIVAPGTNIIAANGFAGPQSMWTSMTGTSMASPFACGVAGLLLAIHPHLTSQQISGIMMRTITPIVGNDYSWKDNTGFGMINLNGCLEEAKAVCAKEDITDTV